MIKKINDFDHYFVSDPKSEMKLGIISTSIRGKSLKFLTASNVFSKKRIDLGSRLLAESMIVPEKGNLLDLGCGYGVVGITAAFLNPNLNVILIDINKRAVWLALQNVKLNQLKNVQVRVGHLYEPVINSIFNCILCNPPISAGIDIVAEIILSAPKLMLINASFQMVVKSKIAGERLQAIFMKAFGSVKILARQSGYRVLISYKQ